MYNKNTIKVTFSNKKEKNNNFCPEPNSLWLCKSSPTGLLAAWSLFNLLSFSLSVTFGKINGSERASISPSVKWGRYPCSGDKYPFCKALGGTEWGGSELSKGGHGY